MLNSKTVVRPTCKCPVACLDVPKKFVRPFSDAYRASWRHKMLKREMFRDSCVLRRTLQ